MVMKSGKMGCWAPHLSTRVLEIGANVARVYGGDIQHVVGEGGRCIVAGVVPDEKEMTLTWYGLKRFFFKRI